MAGRNTSGEIMAAGGVIVRQKGDALQVLLVHRPVFDDWSLPKGKLKRGERETDAALREVGEETNLSCALDAALGEVHYFDRKGRAKVTRYWAMIVIGGTFKANVEADACEWFDIDVAAVRATRSGERDLLARFAERIKLRPPGTMPRVDAREYTVVHEEPF